MTVVSSDLYSAAAASKILLRSREELQTGAESRSSASSHTVGRLSWLRLALRPADQSQGLSSLSCSHEDLCVSAAAYRACAFVCKWWGVVLADWLPACKSACEAFCDI